MKKIYALLLVAAGTILSTTAQPFQKGDKLLGGSINAGFSKSTEDNPTFIRESNAYGLSPSFGFFTRPNRLIGFELQYQHLKAIASSPSPTFRSNYVGANVFKQYWNELGKGFFFIIEGKTGISYGHYSNTAVPGYSTATSNKSIGASFIINPEFAYRVKKRLVLDVSYSDFLSAGYTHTWIRGNNMRSQNNSVNFNTGLRSFSLDNFVFGFRYLL